MSQARYIEDQKAWLLPAPATHECEVLVGGDGVAPDAARLALTETALRSLAELRERAAAFLDEFVDRKKFAPDAEWFLEGFECGLAAHAANEFSLSFSLEGDDYGGWSVTYRCSGGHYFPIAFARCQI
jgi:hypothetical protein